MENTNLSVENLLEVIIKAIVSKPELVKIQRTVDDMGVLLTLNVAQEDVSKVIGKGGETAKAIRMILRMAGFNQKVRANLKIDAPQINRGFQN
jgi:hypothetical protein